MTWDEAQRVRAPILTAKNAPEDAAEEEAAPEDAAQFDQHPESKWFPVLAPPNTTIIKPLLHNGLRGKARSLYGFKGFGVRVGTTSTSIAFQKTDLTREQINLLDEAIRARHHNLKLDRTAYKLEIISLTPDDARSQWFEKLAPVLRTIKVDLECWQGDRRIKDQLRKFKPHKKKVDALTSGDTRPQTACGL